MEMNKTTTNTDEMPLSPEDIKAIGEIELGPAKHEIFLNKHYKKLIAGGIAVMVAASAGIGYYSYKCQQAELAGASIVQAMGTATAEGVVEPSAYDAKLLTQVSTEYADTNSAELAQLLEAQSLLTDSARVENALSLLEGLAARTKNDLLKARAIATIATYYMNEEQNDKAVAAWQQIIALPSNPYSAVAYINLGDLARLAGDIEGARGYYTQVKAACPLSPLVRENVAELRLALLDVDAPKPVAKAEPETPATPAQPAATDNPFGIDTANPFGTAQPTTPATDGGSTDPFGGMSTLPGGAN